MRLVSLHPLLSLTVAFLRVPEIYDGFEFKIFISHTETVAEAIQRTVGELGLTKSLPIPGAGNLEYVIDEVWVNGKQESMFKCISSAWSANNSPLGSSRLPGATLVKDVLGFPFSPNPLKSTARRVFRFNVPDEWFRRSKPRSVPSSPTPSDATLRRLESLQETEEEDNGDEDDEEEGEGTAKAISAGTQAATKTVGQRGLVTQARLSSIFEGWLPSSPSPTSRRSSAVIVSESRKSVSEPRLLEQRTGPGVLERKVTLETSDDDEEVLQDAQFEDMLVSFAFINFC